MSTTYDFKFWAVFAPARKPRITTPNPPTLARDERAMFITVQLPKSLWQTPQLKATINIDDPGVTDVALDVQAARDALRAALGMDIDLRVTRVEE